jgi:hypothetical protein
MKEVVTKTTPKRTVGEPLANAFKRGTIDPDLEPYAYLVMQAYQRAHGAGEAELSMSEIVASVVNDDEAKVEADDGDNDASKIGSVQSIIAPEWQYDPVNHTGPSKTGAELIAGLLGVNNAIAPDRIPSSNPLRLTGAEIKAGAAMICLRLEYRCGPLWRPLIDAVIRDRTLTDIGRDFGGNSRSSSAIGREKVKDGLLFAKEVFDALRREEREAGWRSEHEPIPAHRYALGPIGDQMPLRWRQAENDNLRGPPPRPDVRLPVPSRVVDAARMRFAAYKQKDAKSQEEQIRARLVATGSWRPRQFRDGAA